MQVIERPLLGHVGLGGAMRSWHNLAPAELYEHATARGEANIVSSGALSADTGQHTGRSPKDKFFVEEPSSQDKIWWHTGNRPISAEHFDQLFELMAEYIRANEVYVRDLFACADPRYRLKVRVVTQYAWHSLFVNNLFIRPSPEELEGFEPDFTVMALPQVRADPSLHGTRSETFILVNFARRTVLIGGTRYAGEMKKSIFTALNYLMPEAGALPMHCSANVGEAGNVALFFGLSGTGKTTLSSDPTRKLIGDDEHGWSDEGVFNFEGGCYAKTIRISKDAEPEIYAATNSFGTVLENVAFDPDTRVPDYDDGSKTENTRSAYPVELIPNADLSGRAAHPSNVVFLSADAFGVLPPVARLNDEQVRYFFLSGYTAKVAGTERGVTEPEPTFSSCFAGPFLVLSPETYAQMLVERLHKHDAQVWMLNTGWVGGAYGVGKRISIAHTRAIVRAVVEGRLRDVETRTDPVFGLAVPVAVPNVPSEVLNPRSAWPDAHAYDQQAQRLREMFEANLARLAEAGAVEPTEED
ncbi:MAG: phosphoenolpyruvate carboxykinase (ATP) [Candidatus Dormibacteraeota bacterium]|uniref:Phosphoenolpyruvate carboxykinase (ATP) n=1 Tax=Candidatus Dormiibacter inghamiae TaxID=3127013 RepID=A0A934KGN5_9BACT|nr:phosphoenolpyruvate carboxykinase (ATP) [Candidatus Dormibacteraeota bacterium]MBJ7606246.1 phosphoenolpyruvate carboxykinase (ATP) [Candidatus Dormibacteraeota bacterium]